MPAIRSVSDIAAKWARVTPTRTDDYRAGVAAPAKDWQQQTVAAATNYEAGVTAAIGRKAFAAGVNAAGNAKWQRGALEKGVPRWGQGVQVAQGDFETAFRPFRDVIERTNLPPRYPRGDSRNIARVTPTP